MRDIDEQFAAADQIPAPDLWNEILDRRPRAPDREANRRRVVALMVGFAVAAGGIALAIRAWDGGARPAGKVGNGSVMFMGRPGRLFVISPGGGVPNGLATIEGLTRGASWSPDGTRLAFVREFEVPTPGTSIVLKEWAVFVSRPDGSGARRLGCPGPFIAEGQCSDSGPVWSPDGTRIAFGRQDAIWIMGADGSNPHAITEPRSSPGDLMPAWSPDGTEVSFARGVFGGTYELDVAGVGGNAFRTLVSCQTLHCRGVGPMWSTWSPDGRSIAFAMDGQIWLLPARGGAPRALVDCVRRVRLAMGTSCAQAFDPEWSPDGTLIVFLVQDALHSLNVYAMDSDGSNLRQLTHDGRGKCCLAWRPRPASG